MLREAVMRRTGTRAGGNGTEEQAVVQLTEENLLNPENDARLVKLLRSYEPFPPVRAVPG